MKLFTFKYCDCVHTGRNVIMSLHFTEEGAQDALDKHKAERKVEYEEYVKNMKEISAEEFNEYDMYPFGEDERWNIGEIEVQK